MPRLEGKSGSNVTLCINDANLCLAKCVCMTQRKCEEVSIIPRRSSSWISGKGTCFIRGLPHTGTSYLDCLSVSYEQITCHLKFIPGCFQSVLYTAARMIFFENKFGRCPPPSSHWNILSFPFLLGWKAIKASLTLKVLQNVALFLMPNLWELGHAGHCFLLWIHTLSAATTVGPLYLQFSLSGSTFHLLLPWLLV